LKVFLTGATGFIGSAILRQLIERGDNVHILVRPESNQKNLRGLDFKIFLGNLNDIHSVKSGMKNCEALIHVAADYRMWSLNPNEILETNVIGTRNIMTAALSANVRRIVYTSSVATLGKNMDGSPANEDTPASLKNMIGTYKKSKYLAEKEVSRMISENSLPAIIVNPSAPVGPRDIKPTPTGQIIVKAATGKMPAYIETGLNIVHVDDVARGHLQALDKGVVGERYILGGENFTFKGILELVADCTGNSAPRIKIPRQIVLPIAHIVQTWAKITKSQEPFVTVDGVRMAKQKMYYDSEKAQLKLGYKYRPAREAVQDAVKWFSKNGYLN